MSSSVKFLFVFIINIFLVTPVIASCSSHVCNQNCSRNYNCPNCHSSSSSSNPVYLVSSFVKTEQTKFPNCDEHYIVTEITTNYYSDGTSRIISNSTIYNSDGAVLIGNCSKVKHFINENKHYFIVKQGKYYKIINAAAKDITTKHYTYIDEISSNRFLVKLDKLYGVIDINDKVIIPVVYKEFEHLYGDIYLTKLNRYYGMLTIENEIIIPNDCEKIKPLFETFLLKRYNKYGLVDYDGNIILPIDYDKIKKMGSYIVALKDKKYSVYDFQGKRISDYDYKSIKFDRNKLLGQNFSGNWILVEK